MTLRYKAMLGVWVIGALGALMMMPVGCQQSLFSERNHSAEKLKYFSDSEPVVGLRERRQQNAATGFGMSNGPASQ